LVFKYKLVILDYDLTLVNNIVDFYMSFIDALNNTLGYTISFNEFSKHLYNDKLDVFLKNVDKRRFWVLMRTFICYYNKSSILNKNVERFLETTSSFGLINVIVSGKECHPEVIYRELELMGIRDYISRVYTFYDLNIHGGLEEVLFDKSWLLKKALIDHGVEPWQAVYIGDYIMDYYSSLKTGVDFIAYAICDERLESFKARGVKTIRDFNEALYIILSENTSSLNQLSIYHHY